MTSTKPKKVGRGKSIDLRARKLTHKFHNDPQLLDEGTSVEKCCTKLLYDLDMQQKQKVDAGKKKHGILSAERPPLNIENLIKRANSHLANGVKPRKLVSTLRESSPFSEFTAKHILDVLQREGILKKRT